MGTKLLQESASTLTKSGNRWKAVLAKGNQQGSSGYYSEDVLREYGPAALAPGAKAFVNHDPARNPKDMIGTYPDGAYYEEGVGLVGELDVFPHWKEFVEAVGPHAGLSIYMMGESDEDGNVTKLIPDRQNGVDLVSYPGLEGSGLVEKLYESAHAHSEKPGVNSAQEKRNKHMEEEIKALKGAVEALTTLLTSHIAESKAAADAATQVEADAKTAEEAVEEALAAYDEKVKAIEAADLAPSQAEALRAEAKKGADVAPLIESAQKLLAEVREGSGASALPGRFVAAESASSDFTVPNWKVA
jgi:hypothetical protein